MSSIGTPLLASLDARIEAALLAAGRPIKEPELARHLPHGVDVRASLERIAAFWKDRGINLHQVAAGWVMEARTELLPEATPLTGRKLSEAAIATLAAIAMHQPVTIPQIEKIRGVKVLRAIIDSLVAGGLVEEVGRKSGTGRAIAYAVTQKFLERFDLESLAALPTPEEAFLLDLDLEAARPVTASASSGPSLPAPDEHSPTEPSDS